MNKDDDSAGSVRPPAGDGAAGPAAGRAMYVGIDLGTTNSCAALFDGESLQTVRGVHGGGLTPSAVRIDRHGRVQTGHRARRQADQDPANTALEFKRLMGTGKPIAFPDAGTSRRPEELAAEVLRALRADVRDQFGFEPERAVVSVPALFELPQAEATADAARLAGFSSVELIQEPIASALAAGWRAEEESGPWLVYDLGGGTFDVSLLETRDGLLRVVGHDGDNFLGGRDVDVAIVDWILQELPLLGLSRSRATDSAALRSLQRIAEEAKIELSRRTLAPLNLESVAARLGPAAAATSDLELSLTRQALEAMCAPLVARTLEVCQRLLTEHGLGGADLSRVVLVGGPTAMPGLRARIAEAFGAPVAEGLDPMTLVAHGAALYAAASQLDARPRTAALVPARARTLWLQYPTISADLTPHVIGRLTAAAGALASLAPPTRLTLTRTADGVTSEASFDEHGTFVAMVELRSRTANHFSLTAVDDAGHAVLLHPSELTIVQGLSVADPPLSRSVGVALADDRVQVYFERGAPLPGRRTFTHHAIETIAAGDEGAVLRIPIVQGELDRAHLCRLVGTLEISGASLAAPLAAGQAIDVTVEIDRGGRLSAKAYVASLDRVFEHVERLLVPEADSATLEASLTELRRRLAEIRVAAFRHGTTKVLDRVETVEAKLAAAERDIDASSGGDTDAAQKARRTLLEVDAQLAAVELEASWPELEDAARHALAFAAGAVGAHGTDAENRLLSELHDAVDVARAARNASELERQLRLVRRLANTAVHRDPEIWQWHFDNARREVHAATDIARANELVAQGERVAQRGDMNELRSIVRSLWKLLPPEAQLKEVAYHSGLR